MNATYLTQQEADKLGRPAWGPDSPELREDAYSHPGGRHTYAIRLPSETRDGERCAVWIERTAASLELACVDAHLGVLAHFRGAR